MPKKTKNILLLLVVLMLPFFGIGCKEEIDPSAVEQVTLNYWRVFDTSADFAELIDSFNARYKFIRVNMRILPFEEYENEFLNAIAEGRGPDIISIHNTDMRRFKDRLSPQPDAITLPVAIKSGPSTKYEEQPIDLTSARELRNNFVDVVADDVYLDGTVYGLPLSVDTMVLYYNRQMLNRANIPEPPSTWTAFKDAVKKLTIQNTNGDIIQSGAAIGTSRNINRAPDLLAVLMMQNGTEMTDASKQRATFQTTPSYIEDRNIVPGEDAVRFYTDFASPAKEVYTWNEKMPEALEAFAAQKTAFFFGYSYHLPMIRSLAPGLDVRIAPLPQISGSSRPVNFANYWIEGVTRQAEERKVAEHAWAFLEFATQQENVKSYLTRAQKPTALRSLIVEQKEDPSLEMLTPFFDQLLTAQSWYHGKNIAAVEEAFRTLIDQVVQGTTPVKEALIQAAQKVNQTYK